MDSSDPTGWLASNWKILRELTALAALIVMASAILYTFIFDLRPALAKHVLTVETTAAALATHHDFSVGYLAENLRLTRIQCRALRQLAAQDPLVCDPLPMALTVLPPVIVR